MHDKLITGAKIGLLADIIKLSFNYLTFKLGFSQMVFWKIVATRFLPPSELDKPLALLIGGIADLTTTTLLGAAFLYLLHYTGPDYLWFKGIGFGMALWVGLFGSILSQANLKVDATTILSTAIAHLLFGLSLAYFTKLLHIPLAERNLKR